MRPSRLAALFTVLGLLWLQSPAVAGDVALFFEQPPSALVSAVSDVARRNLGQVKRADGTFVAPETAAERSRPLISLKESRLAVDTGMVSGIANWCRLEWQRSHYLSYMKWQRARRLWSDKQLAYIALLHGIAKGVAERKYRETGECSEPYMNQIYAWIAKRW